MIDKIIVKNQIVKLTKANCFELEGRKVIIDSEEHSEKLNGTVKCIALSPSEPNLPADLTLVSESTEHILSFLKMNRITIIKT